VLGGICVGHAALVQLSVLFAAGGRVRALRNVRRTLALLVDRSLLGAAVHYTTVRAIRVFGLVARERVETP